MMVRNGFQGLYPGIYPALGETEFIPVDNDPYAYISFNISILLDFALITIWNQTLQI